MVAGQEDGSQSRSRSQSDEPDGYFNDLTRQPSGPLSGANEQQPKSKRMACVLCRKRKLRCDGARPACATCARLSHDCAYDEARKKSGPKRGYVKALEARLAQVETMLKSQDPPDETNPSENNVIPMQTSTRMETNDMDVGDIDLTVNCYPHQGLAPPVNETRTDFHPIRSTSHTSRANIHTGPTTNDRQEERSWTNPINPVEDTWGALIGLDIEEPLPQPEIIEELNQVYFSTIHSTMPMIHRPRYLMSMANTSPKLRPPVALQYIVWAFAAFLTDKYQAVHHHYYERARHYFERDEMRGQGEGMATLQHVQALALIAGYEFKFLMFPRAWQSTGKAARLATMLGLHRVDGNAMDVKQCLPPPKDWIEREERKRTYWQCFNNDRYASIGTGWPLALEELDIRSDLPASEDAFERGYVEPTISLAQALQPGGASRLSSFGAVSVLACLFGRNLLHLHRPSMNEDESSLSGEFWRRHRSLDNIVLNTSLALPEHLRLPMAISNPNSIFMNMCLHTSTICLHQAAIFKADKHRPLAKVSAESKLRCITAAAEIASVMRLTSHQDMSAVNPFMCFCLYVASRVFIQYIKSRPQDEQIRSSLFFMLSAMYAMKKKNPLAESFLVQLDVDLEGAGLEDMRSLSSESPQSIPTNLQVKCPMSHLLSHNQDLPIRHTHTFGDNGLAKHSSPPVTKLGTSHTYLPPGSAFNGILPAHFAASTIPVRHRTGNPSDQSPYTQSPDMEMGGSATASNSQSPSSTQNDSSGRVSSITSVTPPSINQDDPLQAQTFYGADPVRKRSDHIIGAGFSQLASADQDMVFTSSDSFPNVEGFDFLNSAAGGAFDFTTYSQDANTSAQQKTGMTPVNTNDLGSMTDAEFNAMMSGVSEWDTESMEQMGAAQTYQVPRR